MARVLGIPAQGWVGRSIASGLAENMENESEQITYIISQEAGGDSEMGHNIAFKSTPLTPLLLKVSPPLQSAILEGNPLTHGNLGEKLTQLL